VTRKNEDASIVAVAITLALLAVLIAFVNNDSATKALREWFRVPIAAAVFWFISGPLWTLAFTSWRRGSDA